MTCRCRLTLATILILLSSGPHPARAESPALTDVQQRTLLDEAQRDYQRGVELLRTDPVAARIRFQSAADRFQLLVDGGISNGRLYYNLANAQLQADHLGPAILNYRRAQRLIPADQRLESNLSYARSLCRTQIASSGKRRLLDALLILHHRTATRTRFMIGAIFYIAFWLGLLGRLMYRHPWWKYPLIAFALVWSSLGVSVTSDLLLPGDRNDGVIITDEVVVRKGNGEGFEPQFEEPLFQGVEFTCLERRIDWLHIQLPDSGTGWIRADQAAMIATSEKSSPGA